MRVRRAELVASEEAKKVSEATTDRLAIVAQSGETEKLLALDERSRRAGLSAATVASTSGIR